MYYLYLTIFIIISYLIIDINLKNKLNIKLKNDNINNNINDNKEHFYSRETPSFSFPSPTPSISKQSESEEIVIPRLDIPEIMEYMITDFKLIYLNPKYGDEIIEEGEINNETKNNRPEIIKKKNTNWKEDYVKDICRNGRCGCINVENKEICGYNEQLHTRYKTTYNKTNNSPIPNQGFDVSYSLDYDESDGRLYQCPMKCPKCSKCHRTRDYVGYQSMCFNENMDIKKKCRFYEGRARYMDQKCNFKDIKIKNKNFVKGDIDKNCKMFFRQNNNNYFIGTDILLKLNINFIDNNYKNELINSIKDFEINIFTFDNKVIDYNIFFYNNQSIYIYMIPTNEHKGENKKISIMASVIFNNNKEIKFTSNVIVNIYDRTEYANRNKKKVDEDFYKDIKSSDFNKFNLNYINPDDTYVISEKLYKDISFYNPITDLENGEFIKEEILDTPESWRERVDIARPWISTG